MKPPSRQEVAEARLWDELARICREVRDSWYVTREKTSGERYLREIDRILERLPENDMAIVREDALAWRHQLKGDNVTAIRHRRREIQLIELLHQDVRENVATGKYNAKIVRALFADRGPANLAERRAILRSLEQEIAKGTLLNSGPDWVGKDE